MKKACKNSQTKSKSEICMFRDQFFRRGVMILMTKRLVSVQGTSRGFDEVFKPLLYDRCQGETQRKSSEFSPTFHRRKFYEISELDLALSRILYFYHFLTETRNGRHLGRP
jgi:hypothetical protein